MRPQNRGLKGHHITSYEILDVMHTFWRGYDEEVAYNHPKDGSEGMLIMFVDQDRINEIKSPSGLLALGNNWVILYAIVPDNMMEIKLRNTDDYWIDHWKNQVYNTPESPIESPHRGIIPEL